MRGSERSMLRPACRAMLLGLSAGLTAARAAPLATVPVAEGLASPVFAASPPGDFGRLFVVEQDGFIQIVDLATGVIQAPAFLDIDSIVRSGGEQGLLGLAFHPAYAENGYFFVYYTDEGDDTVIARYTRSADPDFADDESGRILLTIEHPYTNHNGGWISFGPDGYLYIATGDGGAGCDFGEHAQDVESPLGKILRLDVDGDDFPKDDTLNYAIPPSNPFVDEPGRDEIWAVGLRNPWRCGFDRLTGDLYIGDVGQDVVEEVDVLPGGSSGRQNFGWDCMEGTACSTISNCDVSGCTCNEAGLIPPIHEYTHSDGYSVVGGYPYRGCAIPGLQGVYLFADYSGRIWSLRYTEGAVTEFTDRQAELDPPGPSFIGGISAFAEDAAGEIYILGHWTQTIFRIVPFHDRPADIDADGLVDGLDASYLVAGILGLELSDPALACRSDVDGDGAYTGEDIRIWLDGR